jgi:O-antigen/teichoic acid export membrane protein
MSKFPRNLLTVYVANGLNGVVSVIAIPIAVSLLGLAGYGLLSFYAVMGSYILLADLGIGKNLLRLLAEPRERDSKLRHVRVATGLYIVLCFAWIAALPLLVVVVPRYVFPVSQEFVAGLRWMVCLSILEFALGIPASLMQTSCAAEQRFDAYSGYALLSGLLRNAAIIGGALAFHSAAGVAACLAARKVLELFVAGRLLGWLPAAACRPIFELRSFRGMLSQSVTLSAAQLLTSTLTSAGSLFVNAAFGLSALGLYRAAYDLAGKIAFVSNGVTLVVFPKAAQYFGGGSLKGSGPVFGPLLRASTLLYTSFAATMVLAAPLVLPSIGLKNHSTVELFLLLVIALSINAHSLIGNELIQAAGRYGRSVWFSGSALVTLTILFASLKAGAGLMAIGWAWIGASLVSATVADTLLLGLCEAGSAEQISTALVKLAAVAACLCLALPYFGVISNPAATICAAILGAGVAVVTARGLLPLARTWRKEQHSSPAEERPAVWA